MSKRSDTPADRAGWRGAALKAGGVVGTWEWDHRREIMHYCREAAELMAGNAELANHDLTASEALAGVYTDDVAWLRDQMRRSSRMHSVFVREHRVHSAQRGIRRVLCRGQTYHDRDGRPIVTLGIIIDITEIEADGRQRHILQGEGALDTAADHGIAAYEAIEETGLSSLLQPARLLLTAIGREIARRMRGDRGRLQ